MSEHFDAGEGNFEDIPTLPERDDLASIDDDTGLDPVEDDETDDIETNLDVYASYDGAVGESWGETGEEPADALTEALRRVRTLGIEPVLSVRMINHVFVDPETGNVTGGYIAPDTLNQPPVPQDEPE